MAFFCHQYPGFMLFSGEKILGHFFIMIMKCILKIGLSLKESQGMIFHHDHEVCL
jgi:hypothetical protein